MNQVASTNAQADLSQIKLRWPSEHPPLNELFAFDIAVEGTVQAATVDADMPAHGHGMLSKPMTTLMDDGTIHVEGMLFHMPGDWVVTLDCTVDGTAQRHDVPVTIDF